jgi:hypothetical protein
MESNYPSQEQTQEELLLQETYNDDYWSKEYDVTKGELKQTCIKDNLDQDR